MLLFVHSDSILLTLLSQFCPTILFDFHISFSQQWLHPYLTYSLLALAPTEPEWCLLLWSLPQQSFWEGYLICFALWFLRNSNFASLWFQYPKRSAVAIWFEYPITGSTNTSTHFESVIKFVMAFTTVVMNSRIMTSLIVQILPFTPLRSYPEMFRPFTVFLLEITVLRCTCFQISPSCCNYFSVIVTTKWSMSWVLICTCTLAPYWWFETTKNNTSSLYQGKSGIVMLASRYFLYGIKMPSSPWDVTHLLSNSQWKDPKPHFCTESLSGQRFGT